MIPRPDQLYALRLCPDPGHPGALAGELEQVCSGERRHFADAAGLVAALQALQAAAPPGPAAPAPPNRP